MLKNGAAPLRGGRLAPVSAPWFGQSNSPGNFVDAEESMPLSLAFFILITCAMAQEPGVTPATCPPGINSIADCSDSGCGDIGDAFLNHAKNRTDIPAPADVQDLSITELASISQPASWKTGTARDSIVGPGREGTPIRLVGRLKFVKREHKETCNCELNSVTDTDIHLVVVKKLSDPEEKSVTFEITPRVRAAGHANWVFHQVSPLQGKLVRVTGWLMLDTGHLHQSSLLPGEHLRAPLKRLTNWEIHPVTKLEVCHSTIAACNAGQGWQEF
jgi:hypothetical protein